jgi:hypothetical protein
MNERRQPDNRDSALPPVLDARDKDSYPWHHLHEIWPQLLTQVREDLPYPPQTRRAIDQIEAELSAGILQPWQTPFAGQPAEPEPWRDDEHLGRAWPELPFLYAENYFASKLLDAVGYHTGPWQGIDPYGPGKAALLARETALAPLDTLDELAGLDTRERGHALLRTSLAGPAEVSLVIDQSRRLWAHLASTAPGRVCLIADSAAAELVSDLLLIDFLLTEGFATQVDLHLPPHPWRPAQATTADLLACLGRLPDHPHGATLADRLWSALVDGRLEAVTHEYYCSPAPLHIEHLPAELREAFATARLTILKGDHNYRRLVQDRLWPHETTFTTFTRTFPGPLLALRPIRTPPLVGATHGVNLDSTTTSVPGVIQIGL